MRAGELLEVTGKKYIDNENHDDNDNDHKRNVHDDQDDDDNREEDGVNAAETDTN